MSGLLTACDMGDLRDAALLLMGDTATISRPTLIRDSSGGYATVYAPAGSTPIQLIRPTGPAGQVRDGEQAVVAPQMVGKVPLSTSLILGDRLTVSAQRFQVVSLYPDATIASARRVGLDVIP